MPIYSHPIIEQIQGLRRYARALTGGKMENADDLVQDTLERAYAKWHLFKLGTELRPWLFSIMHNVFVSESKPPPRRNDQWQRCCRGYPDGCRRREGGDETPPAR